MICRNARRRRDFLSLYGRRNMKRRISTLFALLWLGSMSIGVTAPLHAAGESAERPREQLGKVSFPTSCDPKVQQQFERGVALLHSFSFQLGRKAFDDVLEADSSCAIAYWGIGVNRLLNPFCGQPPGQRLSEGPP